MTTHKIKIVCGDFAARLHSQGEPDSRVEDEGTIVEHEFATEGELNAYCMALEDLDGWLGWTYYDEDNLE